MATRVPTVKQGTVDNSLVYVTWTGLLNGDDGTPIQGSEWATDRSVQFTGTLGVGGTVVFEGTNEETPENWVTLTDPQGNNISKTAIPALEAVQEVTRWVRPRVTAGDGTTNFTVNMLVRRGNPLRT